MKINMVIAATALTLFTGSVLAIPTVPEPRGLTTILITDNTPANLSFIKDKIFNAIYDKLPGDIPSGMGQITVTQYHKGAPYSGFVEYSIPNSNYVCKFTYQVTVDGKVTANAVTLDPKGQITTLGQCVVSASQSGVHNVIDFAMKNG